MPVTRAGASPLVAQAINQLKVEIVKRSALKRFVLLPKRWLVERTIAWLNRCRRTQQQRIASRG